MIFLFESFSLKGEMKEFQVGEIWQFDNLVFFASNTKTS